MTNVPGRRRTSTPTWVRLPRLLLQMAVIGVMGAIAGSFGESVHPMLDVLTNFQMQYLLASLGSAAGLWLLRSRRWSMLAGLTAIPPALALMPWYWPQPLPPDVELRTVIRVMQFNVLEGNDQYEAVAAEVRDQGADLVVFQEIDNLWLKGLKPLGRDFAFTYFQPGGSLRGNLIYSRHPIRNVLLEPSVGQEAAPSVSMELAVNGQRVSILIAHTVPPHGTMFIRQRNAELQRLAERVRQLPPPLVVLGDLNTGMWSAHYKAFEQASGLTNTRRRFGIVNTFPMDGYALLRVPLDHCLVSSDIAVLDFRRGQASGSDHAPIIADLALPTRSTSLQR